MFSGDGPWGCEAFRAQYYSVCWRKTSRQHECAAEHCSLCRSDASCRNKGRHSIIFMLTPVVTHVAAFTYNNSSCST